MKRKMAAAVAMCVLTAAGLFAGCGQSAQDPGEPPRDVIAGEDESAQQENTADNTGAELPDTASGAAGTDTEESTSLEDMPGMTIQFGYDGPIYSVQLEANDTAATLADYASRGEYNLPIYTYENYENEEVLQFYDIPSRYEVPAETEHYTEEKAGELYYSYPNRIVLFYQDAQVEADYTRIGTLTRTEGLVDAVTRNEPLDDWDCLVIPVRVIR